MQKAESAMGVWVLFFKNVVKKLWGFCILGFVAGVFVAFIMPPAFIAIIEGILLMVVCVAFYCRK